MSCCDSGCVMAFREDQLLGAQALPTQEVCSNTVLQTMTRISDVDGDGPCEHVKDNMDSLLQWAMPVILLVA